MTYVWWANVFIVLKPTEFRTCLERRLGRLDPVGAADLTTCTVSRIRHRPGYETQNTE